MKRIWLFIIVVLAVLAVVFFVTRPDSSAVNPAEDTVSAEEAEVSAPDPAEPAVLAEPPVQAEEDPVEEQSPEVTDVEESEYVEDYTVELGDDEVFEIG